MPVVKFLKLNRKVNYWARFRKQIHLGIAVLIYLECWYDCKDDRLKVWLGNQGCSPDHLQSGLNGYDLLEMMVLWWSKAFKGDHWTNQRVWKLELPKNWVEYFIETPIVLYFGYKAGVSDSSRGRVMSWLKVPWIPKSTGWSIVFWEIVFWDLWNHIDESLLNHHGWDWYLNLRNLTYWKLKWVTKPIEFLNWIMNDWGQSKMFGGWDRGNEFESEYLFIEPKSGLKDSSSDLWFLNLYKYPLSAVWMVSLNRWFKTADGLGSWKGLAVDRVYCRLKNAVQGDDRWTDHKPQSLSLAFDQSEFDDWDLKVCLVR